MEFDVFFSICHTPDANGNTPEEDQMFSNFFEQLELADKLGYKIAWVAQAHLSTEIQKLNSKPVVPHWNGEIGLCTDFFQLAHHMFSKTKNIEVGSAVMSLLCNGGPIGAAERIGAFCTLHGLNKSEKRRLHIGFSSGRFEFMAKPYGIVPRDSVEEVSWKVIRTQIFREASEIFLRLINGEVISSNDISETILTADLFKTEDDWKSAQHEVMKRDNLESVPDKIKIEQRYKFEQIKTIPQNWNRNLLNLVIGSHDSNLQTQVNKWRPVQVFNLSITQPKIIEETHQRMSQNYHEDGGPWKRNMMPRTVMIFINEEEGLTDSEKSRSAMEEANLALGSYWNALEGTVDPEKVSNAANNAVIGNASEIAKQLKERFHQDDKIMCWFDFFNHDSERVCRNMTAFIEKVVPELE